MYFAREGVNPQWTRTTKSSTNELKPANAEGLQDMVKIASANFFEILAFDLANFWPLAFATLLKICMRKGRSNRKLSAYFHQNRSKND